MRCSLDRPGSVAALERRDPHPFTYVCAGCHAEVLAEFPQDLAHQMDRWPRHLRDVRVMQRAGRASTRIVCFVPAFRPDAYAKRSADGRAG